MISFKSLSIGSPLSFLYLAGGGYKGELIENVKKAFGWEGEIILRTDAANNFTVLPKDRLWKGLFHGLRA